VFCKAPLVPKPVQLAASQAPSTTLKSIKSPILKLWPPLNVIVPHPGDEAPAPTKVTVAPEAFAAELLQVTPFVVPIVAVYTCRILQFTPVAVAVELLLTLKLVFIEEISITLVPAGKLVATVLEISSPTATLFSCPRLLIVITSLPAAILTVPVLSDWAHNPGSTTFAPVSEYDIVPFKFPWFCWLAANEDV